MLDAIGNQIELGKHYGYSLNANGIQTIVIGRADSFPKNKGNGGDKVTLTNVHERSSYYGKINGDFTKQDRKRSVYACNLFPILTLAEYRNIQIDSILADD
jgi:hypothetical protein